MESLYARMLRIGKRGFNSRLGQIGFYLLCLGATVGVMMEDSLEEGGTIYVPPPLPAQPSTCSWCTQDPPTTYLPKRSCEGFENLRYQKCE